MATWRVARSLDVLLEQIDAAAPRRSKASDGSIGDPAHHARRSDHNPDERGVVRARDLTHDPAGGFDAHAFAERLRQARDPRISYVISNGRWFKAYGPTPWTWQPYTGPSPHSQHVHVSVVAGIGADESTPWAGVTAPTAASRIPDVDQEDHDMTPEQAKTLDNIAWTVGQIKGTVDGLASKLHAVHTQVDRIAWGVLDQAAGLRTAVADLTRRIK